MTNTQVPLSAIFNGRMTDEEKFLKGYIEAMLWAETDGDTDKPLDDDKTADDICPDALKVIKDDCEKFWRENSHLITEENYRNNHNYVEHAGHDFWLTRKGHGSGFFDGDWEDEAGEKLTKACKEYDEFLTPFVQDDGTIDFV